ncbi:hypothetical protein LCL95_08775 [Bacillus timonensis]|nr:hypothetical protein [Bacillus timonensis]
MSHSHCPKCGKHRAFDHDHFDQYDHFHSRFKHHNDFHNKHPHHRDHFHKDCGCDHHKDFICDRFICDDEFRLRLGGLQGGLNFRLRQLIGCKVKMELSSGKKYLVEICFIGADFAEVKVLKDLTTPEPAPQDPVTEECPEEMEAAQAESKKKKRRRRRRRRKNKACKALIIPFDQIKFVEVDCDDDCHH